MFIMRRVLENNYMKTRLFLLLLCLAATACGDEVIQISNILLSADKKNLAPGETIQVSAVVFPESAASISLRWRSSDNNVLSVSNGIVRANAPGSATILVGSEEQPDISRIDFHVLRPVSSISFDEDKTDLVEGFDKELKLTILPEDAEETNISWSSSDETVASVNSGWVKGNAVGQAIISAKLEKWDITASCVVCVVSATPRTITYTTRRDNSWPACWKDMDGNPLLSHVRSSGSGKLIFQEELKKVSRFTSDTYEFTMLCLPDVTEIIESDAFGSSSSLQTINFPSTLKEIGNYAFDNSALREVVLPDSVNRLGRRAFFLCRNLKKLRIGNGIETITTEAFIGCDSLQVIDLGVNVKKLEEFAFGSDHFDNWRPLDTIVFRSPTPPSVPIGGYERVFSSSCYNTTIVVPAGAKDSYVKAGWSRCKEVIER